jgi:hypothetical protein
VGGRRRAGGAPPPAAGLAVRESPDEAERLPVVVDRAALVVDEPVDYLPFVPNSDYGVGALSMYQVSVAANYMVEYNAELARRLLDPTLPSRLSAVYAFGTKADAQRGARAAGRPKWEVYAFQLVRDELTRVARVNMNIVSLMRYAIRIASLDAQTLDHVWSQYWSGGAEIQLELRSQPMLQRKVHDSGVTWEYLIEGRLDLLKRRH